ncbi:hypothetical protein E2562_005862 [Oryza meyeriana var. granulata]|uniref:Uncharacterized protein n=1 Tax=Oryza meyeriana var. granulata TaxID=110450 RepID=A0A6G1DVL4_9ORYZ|nr:hypothetical protein E2562_005862 [Oryza meyeriana var. granulata]
MAMYTLHVPFIYKRQWHWKMSTFYIIINLLVAVLVGLRGVKIKEYNIIETAYGDEFDKPNLTFKVVKNALRNAWFLMRTGFFCCRRIFMVILQQRD